MPVLLMEEWTAAREFSVGREREPRRKESLGEKKTHDGKREGTAHEGQGLSSGTLSSPFNEGRSGNLGIRGGSARWAGWVR